MTLTELERAHREVVAELERAAEAYDRLHPTLFAFLGWRYTLEIRGDNDWTVMRCDDQIGTDGGATAMDCFERLQREYAARGVDWPRQSPSPPVAFDRLRLMGG